MRPGLIQLVAGMALAFAAPVALAATSPGKPVDIPTPYIPSTTLAVEEMLRLAEVTQDDLVVDLGSGDGRIVIAAARDYGARGLGIDIDPKLVQLAGDNARKAGVADRVEFRHGDALTADIGAATVVTLYLLPGLVEKLRPRLLAHLKPGTRIVAHDFGFATWQPDRTVNISKTFYLYVVPASVDGKWRLQADLPGGAVAYDFELYQRYQHLQGGARVQGGYLPVFEGRLKGERIDFVLVDNNRSHHFEGRVTGASMEGVVHSGAGRERVTNRWRATRVVPGGEGT